jgi:hypothetical protein
MEVVVQLLGAGAAVNAVSNVRSPAPLHSCSLGDAIMRVARIQNEAPPLPEPVVASHTAAMHGVGSGWCALAAPDWTLSHVMLLYGQNGGQQWFAVGPGPEAPRG